MELSPGPYIGQVPYFLSYGAPGPLEPPLGPETKAQLHNWMPSNSPIEPLALFRTLPVRPGLAARMRPQGSALLATGRSPGEREVVVLRAGARRGAGYELEVLPAPSATW
jgi:hypothetical protein